jgi:HD superfamily phosphohydrolase
MTAKQIKCPVYGFIKVPLDLIPFIDHPLFQRLQRIKQLGSCIKVFPSVGHSRMEHSLGVMHLAGIVVDQLREFVEITERQKKLVQLGALYHDIGHIAFSHMFDEFLRQLDTSSYDNFFPNQSSRRPIIVFVTQS